MKQFDFNEETHSYYLDGREMTGCTTILGVLNKPALVPWAARMACEYIRENATQMPHIPLPDNTVGISYIVSDDILEKAEKAHAKKKQDGAQKGTDTHALVEEYVKHCIELNEGNPIGDPLLNGDRLQTLDGRTFVVPKELYGFYGWACENKVKFLASEAKFYSEKLFVAGTADLVFEKDGKRYIGDVKTYKKIWDRVPFFQCAGYALMAEEMGQPKFDGYCIINLPKEREFNEAEDIKWSWDVEGDTNAFLACVTLYRQLKTFKK